MRPFRGKSRGHMNTHAWRRSATAGLLCCLAAGAIRAADGSGCRCGAKVVRAIPGDGTGQPRVVVSPEAAGWRVKEGEAWTGVNPHEFFFTLENPARDASPPTVRIAWPGVRVARVLGALGACSNTADGVAFRLARGRAPTSVGTSLVDGAIHTHVFHNWILRRAGRYRNDAWPTNAIQAQLNYLFAAREMCRAMGYADSDKPDFNGDIRLYGFESNFPNGHVDHPPHFHIMLGWPGWVGTQAGHFLLDDKGLILENRLIADLGSRQESATFRPGEACAMRDPDGRIGFELIIEPGGEGVIMRRAPGQAEFRVHAATGGALTGLEVARRGTAGDGWTPLCRVRAADDAARGHLTVSVTGSDGQTRDETIAYDIDTGTTKP